MDHRAGRNVLERQRITDANLRLRTAHDAIADFQPVWCQDVALFTIHIVEQGDARRAVWIILNGEDLGRHSGLVTLEVDDPVALLDASAPMPCGNVALVVTPGFRVLLFDKGALRLGGYLTITRAWYIMQPGQKKTLFDGKQFLRAMTIITS